MKEPTNQEYGVYWRTNWIGWFESPWGIIEKFHYANLSSSRDFMKLFGTDKIKKLKTTIGKRYKSLMTLAGIDDNSFSSIIGFSLKHYNRKMIERLCEPLYDGDQNSYSYFHHDLMICPLCIKEGYHSVIHQFILVNDCPFHQVDLINATESCDNPSCRGRTYEITGNKTINPFGCTCGSNWLGPMDSYKPKWYMPQKQDIQHDVIREWLDSNHKRQLKKIFYIKRNDKPFSSNKLLSDIMEISKSYTEKSTSESLLIKSTKNIDKIFTVTTPPGIELDNDEFLTNFGPYDPHFDYIFETLKNTITAIARMIRKKIYFKHKNCVIRMKNYLKKSVEHDDPFCPIAFSYLKWRQNIQGFEKMCEVDNYGEIRNKKRQKKMLDIGFELDEVWLQNLFKYIKKQMDFYSPNNIQGLTWVYNRILAHIGINHFNNLLNYTVHCWKEDKYFNFSKHLYKGLENIFIKFPLEIGDSYEFHIYGQSKLMELTVYDNYCKYQKSGQYKLKPSEIPLSPLKVELLKTAER